MPTSFLCGEAFSNSANGTKLQESRRGQLLSLIWSVQCHHSRAFVAGHALRCLTVMHRVSQRENVFMCWRQRVVRKWTRPRKFLACPCANICDSLVRPTRGTGISQTKRRIRNPTVSFHLVLFMQILACSVNGDESNGERLREVHQEQARRGFRVVD